MDVHPTKNVSIGIDPYLEGLRQGTFSFVVLLRSSVCLKDPHWNTTKDDKEKKTSKRVSRVPLRDLRGKKFQGFLSGTSGEKK